MSRSKKLVDLKFRQIITDTEGVGAILFDFGGREQWIPKSVCDVDEASKQVTVEEWFVLKEGLDEFAVV